jgi:hypothetical protein
MDKDLKAFRMNRPGIPQDRIAKRLGLAQQLMKLSVEDGQRINALKRISGSARLVHKAMLERPRDRVTPLSEYGSDVRNSNKSKCTGQAGDFGVRHTNMKKDTFR